MQEIWYYTIAEFRALGLYCIMHGPEFWLVVPTTVAVIAIATMGWIWRR